MTPLAPERYKLQFTIPEKTLEKLDLAKDMLRHAVPSGDLSEVFDRALTVLLEDLAKKKFAATEHAQPSRAPAPGSRHIPAEVKRAVWLRDLGRCTFVGANNRRCTSRGFLEFDHIVPFAVGGEATVENLRLLCKKHNAEESFRSLTPENLQAGRYVRLWKDSVGRSRSPEYGDSIDRTPQRWGRTGRVLQGTRAPKTASGVDCDLFGSAS